MARSIRSRLLSTLAVLAVLAVSVIWIAPALGSPGAQQIKQGTLTMDNSAAGPILSLELLNIGDVRTGSVTITNSGSLAGDYTLSHTASGGSALLKQLHVTIVRTGPSPTTVYAGSLATLGQLDLGSFAAGEAHTYRFAVSLPTTGTSAGDNALQGLAGSLSFAWTAVQPS